MMSPKPILYFFEIILSFNLLFGQTDSVLSLPECYTAARQTHPLGRQTQYWSEINRLQLQNLQTQWLPQLNLNGQASYQSDVPQVDLEIPPNPVLPQIEIPTPDQDQYKIGLQINQLIYDGGLTARQKELQQIETAVSQQEIAVEFHQLKTRINQVFFNIHLLKKNREIIKLMLSDLRKRRQTVAGAVTHGVRLPSDLDQLDASILKTEQQLDDIAATLSSAYEILSELIGQSVSPDMQLNLPEIDIMAADTLNRPEQELFRIRSQKLSVLQGLNRHAKQPRLVGFGQFGYGKPGLNMLSNEFDTYYIIGLQLQWNLWDWQKSKREREALAVQKNMITNQVEIFRKNTYLALQKETANIRKYKDFINKDQKIINLRDKIARRAGTQLENGVMTTTDYINHINALSRARLQLEMHRLNLVQAKVNYAILKGDL